jgi:FkbM family methyltransferase
MILNNIKIDQFDIFTRNKGELRYIKKSIFHDEEYKFVSENESPNIIDCGSHIGMSILYFKKIYPQAKILGFEPNPGNFKIVKKNIKINKLTNVKVINAAVSDKKGKNLFIISTEKNEPWTWGDLLVESTWWRDGNNKQIKVKTIKLSKYINTTIDMLKIDIEGMETKVIQEIENKLPLVKQMIIEVHDKFAQEKDDNLNTIKKILKKNNFTIKTISELKRKNKGRITLIKAINKNQK